jgi:hypothetical protein
MMHGTNNSLAGRRHRTAAIAVAMLLITGAAGAANRVVLGEYFTNLF